MLTTGFEGQTVWKRIRWVEVDHTMTLDQAQRLFLAPADWRGAWSAFR